ncbi:glycosyltransferase family 4 protein [Microbacterium sp. G2-8]|uniref:glycosyltransferase family 4 protein n=1 Tax=Microbacterium sp. G2-8 TaxID=2842454 RepID=UPI001C8AE3E4|nr:glycosyltransferase family 4 protein [Microbacterium sp. G2-8]
MTRVIQLGNFGDDGGGISSVLREFESWEWPTSRHTFVDTYATDPRLWGARRLLAAASTLVRRRKSFDVAHIHLSEKGSFVREGLLVRLAQALGLRVVVTMHGATFVEFANQYSWLARGVLKHANAIACLTDPTVNELQALGVTNVTLIPNAVSADQLTADETPMADRMITVFVGEVSRRKGVDVLLDAWRSVSATYPGARLEVYGGPVDVDVPSGGAIATHGRRPRDEVRQAVRSARLLVLPSRAEAFPMAILEAMAAGIPVVATDVGQVRDMIDDDELVVPAEDAEQLAQAMASLYADGARAEAAAVRNEARYARLFSPRVVAEKYEVLYAAGAAHV